MTRFKNTSGFRDIIYTYFRTHGRDLPWRRTYDPYHIMVSEFMLQQTPVERVLTTYEQFLRLFPALHNTAQASLSLVLKTWQGLGYNRRARNLWLSTRVIMEKHNGKLPETEEELMALPGVGRATAGAIMAFAYNKPAVFIETNIRTVFLYFFFTQRESVNDKELMPLIAYTLDKANPRLWYYALMDYGVFLKKKYPRLHHKSAHYKKQTAFKGSLREVRSMILTRLLEKSELLLYEAAQLSKRSLADIQSIVKDLHKEGFVTLQKQRIKLREEG
jgi:A/G-specific adenine glycosylase